MHIHCNIDLKHDNYRKTCSRVGLRVRMNVLKHDKVEERSPCFINMSSAKIIVISPCGGKFRNKVARTCTSHERQCNLKKHFEEDIIDLVTENRFVGVESKQCIRNFGVDGFSSRYVVIVPIYFSDMSRNEKRFQTS